MRTLPSALAVAVLGAVGFSGTAHADAYGASFSGCETAIQERLGLSDTPATYNIEKIRSKARYRQIDYSVTAADASGSVQDVKVSCRAKQNGEVLALEFDDSAQPNALATAANHE